MMEICVDGTFSPISDVAGTNTVFDVQSGNRKIGIFGEDFGGSGPLKKKKNALHLTAENYMV